MTTQRNHQHMILCFLGGVAVAVALNLVYGANAALVSSGQAMSPALWNTNVTRIMNLQARFAEAMNFYPGMLCGAASNTGSTPCVYQGSSYYPETSCPAGFYQFIGNYPNGNFSTCVKE